MVTLHNTGIKWCKEVLYFIHHPEHVDVKDRTEMGLRVPFLDHHHRKIEPRDIIKNMRPVLGMSHLYAQVLGHHVDEGKVKVVYWSMNPRNVLVKFHDTWCAQGSRWLGWPPVDWQTFFEAFRRKELFGGDWFDFTLGWLPYMNHKNVLPMHYEDVACDLEGAVRRVAEFCGKILSDELVAKIAGCCVFDDHGPVDPSERFSLEQMEYFNGRFADEMSGTPYAARYGNLI